MQSSRDSLRSEARRSREPRYCSAKQAQHMSASLTRGIERHVAQFIHLAAESNRRSILRNGIKVSHTKRKYGGVFAHPQVESFVVSHQWMRELKRFRGVSFIAVRFRIPDEELVWIGKYNDEHINVSASEAIGIARAHVEPLGLEVIIPRRIRPKEIEST